MKQKIYILGLLTSIVIILGTLFKINHWPLAGIMIAAGMVTLVFVFLPVALVSHYKNAGERQHLLLYIATWLTAAVIFTGTLFKIEHWPGAGYMLLIALPFPYVFFLPVFLAVTSRIKNFNIYNTVSVLLLISVISVFSLLFGLDVSRDRIYDSLDLGGKYIRLGTTLDQITPAGDQNLLAGEINAIIRIVDEYETKILKQDGTERGEWDRDPKVLKHPTSVDVLMRAMYPGTDAPVDTRLEDGLKKLISDLDAVKEYKALAEAAPGIFDFHDTPDIRGEWSSSIFRSFGQSWVLVYLEGLKTNLKLIKASL